MSKFNKTGTRPAVHSPVKTALQSGTTYEGAEGWIREPESELFLMAVGAMGDEDAFYETAKQRNSRFTALVRQIAVSNPDWLAGFLPWLRTEGNMRTSAIMGAAEYAKARLVAGSKSAPAKTTIRQVIASVLRRADEPGELVAYWTARYGRSLPKPVKRGIADAVRKLYSEYSFLRYDTDTHAYRFGDVIELTHPSANAPADLMDRMPAERLEEFTAEGVNAYTAAFSRRLGDLYQWALASRHNRDGEPAESLQAIRARRELSKMAPAERHALLRKVMDGHKPSVEAFRLAMAGKWEWAKSWAGEGKPDSKLTDAQLWELFIPNMNFFALLRNLRNFDQAGVSDALAGQVIARLTDAGQIRKSGVLPFQVLAAYRHVPSLRWGYPLEQALNHSLANVPALPGKTLVLVDRSLSMYDRKMSDKSDMVWADAAAVFGAALALRAEKADLVEFSGKNAVVGFDKAESALKLTERFGKGDGHNPRLDSGTDIPRAVAENLNGHDRIIIVTDEQTRPGYLPSNMHHYHGGYRETATDELVPKATKLYMWNFGGYSRGAVPSGSGNRHTLGGLSDASFKMITLLDRGRDAKWPWEE